MSGDAKTFQPYVPASTRMREFTFRAVLLGAVFGILFGAANLYLALKAGLTVSASIPIAVLAISIGRKLLKTTILENNIIQTTGSAGESIASGVAFTLPGFLFLSVMPGETESVGADYVNYLTFFVLALFGGILGTLMMIPLRRALIVKEHETLPYPEGTACASVLIAGERGGSFAKTAFLGVGISMVYAFCQLVLKVIAEAPTYVLRKSWFPGASVSANITPEYLGVGYIIGPKIAGILVAGGVLSWLALIPLLASLVPPEVIAAQLLELGYVPTAAGRGGWDAATSTFANIHTAIYFAYVRQIGAGAVAMGGFITVIKTIPTIAAAFKGAFGAARDGAGVDGPRKRTDDDLSIKTVIFGSVALVALTVVLPQIPGDTLLNKLLLGILMIAFGFFFVTVSSRVVGIIGCSSNPISGMTIATLMATCLIFIAIGWDGEAYEPMALVVGGMVCIAAANGGATSQDLKTGYLVGATPKYQQISLFVGAIAAALVIGFTVQVLDKPSAELAAQGVKHAIGTDQFPAPQSTLMATLIKGLLSYNLDWQFVLVGAFISLTMELCGVKALNFAVGAYLPLATTLPIFAGGAVKALADAVARRKGEAVEESELGAGSLFSTGLVAGGALAGVIVALIGATATGAGWLAAIDQEHGFEAALGGTGGYHLLGTLAFVALAVFLFVIARRKLPNHGAVA